MSVLGLQPIRSGLLFGERSVPARNWAMPPAHDGPCGGERIIDFALCLTVAVAVVGLLLLAL